MNAILSRSAIRSTAPDGGAIVLVPLRGGGLATADAADYDDLISLGFTPLWLLNLNGDRTTGIVRCSHRRSEASGGLLSVARLILEAPRGRGIRHRDGDRTNLRRDNIYLVDDDRAGERELTVIHGRRRARDHG